MSTRAEVYEVLDGERDYQDKWVELDKHNNVGDFLVYMKNYLDKAFQANDPLEPMPSLDNVRKVTAIGVAAMEKFGAPERQ